MRRKDGLDLACRVALVPATTRIAVVVDHSPTAGIPYARVVGTDLAAIACYAPSGSVITALNEVATGARVRPSCAPTAVGLYVFPELGPDAIARDGLCATPTTMRLPIAPGGVAALVVQLQQWDDGRGSTSAGVAPAGGQPVAAALGIARDALNASAVRSERPR